MTTARPNNICTRLAAKSGEAVAGELPATDVLTDGALVPAALGGVAFGLGCASKWTGVYAGAGLAIVYFAALLLRHKALAAQPGTTLEKRETYRQDLSFALLAGLGFAPHRQEATQSA